MLNKGGNAVGNLVIRPARDDDRVFVQGLYRTTRDDLRLVDGSDDFIESLIEMQMQAQATGYGNAYPNAMYFVVEQLGDRIGRVTVDFGTNEIHLLDISFVPQARGKGYGAEVLRALQQAAAKTQAPLSLSVHKTNLGARRLYESLGFVLNGTNGINDWMIWYPGKVVC